MKILCSNDDGINATGLGTLEEIAHALSDDVWTVAPEVDQSGMSRSITLTRPLRVRKSAPRRFAVDGTPTDCVQLAVSHLMDGRPDLILSGINNGQNVAEDVTFSGTIAVALHGMTMGIPSIALSQSRSNRDAPCWECAAGHGPDIIRTLLDAGWPFDEVVMNINFPDCEPGDVQGIEVCEQGKRTKVELYAEERTDLRQRRYYWFGFEGEQDLPKEGTDLRAIHDGRIAVTPLHLALTHDPSMAPLKRAFGN